MNRNDSILNAAFLTGWNQSRQEAFIAGAQWADQHPQVNKWVRLSTELPPIGERVLCLTYNNKMVISSRKADYADDPESSWHWTTPTASILMWQKLPIPNLSISAK